jgi:hypothetical protein
MTSLFAQTHQLRLSPRSCGEARFVRPATRYSVGRSVGGSAAGSAKENDWSAQIEGASSS